jgi:hypothetical protein
VLKSRIVPLLVMVAAPQVVLAHEGHGDPGNWPSVHHYLSEPIHAVPLALAFVLLVAFALERLRTHRRAETGRRR